MMTSKCLSCKHKNVKTRYGYTVCNYSGSECRNFELYDPIKKTNYDRIVSKTPEELAEFLHKTRGGCRALTTESYVCDFYTENLDTDCKACWLDWLKEEASEE